MRLDPYSHCPRLPEEGPLDPRRVFHRPPAALRKSSPARVEVPEEVPEEVLAEEELPVELEIGPGRGWFTVERLEVDPSVRIVGLEIKRKWATIVDERLAKRKLGHRGRIFAEDAKLVLPRFVSGSVRVAYLHFPDPWWKKRHQKRLVLQDSLLVELSRILTVGGELFIQTDVFERADEYEAEVAACSAFEPYGPSARVSENPFQARSPRERKAIENGLPVARLHYRCRGPVS